jgi:hypothetical protein
MRTTKRAMDYVLMLKLANDYDKFADRAEDRVARDEPRPGPRAKQVTIRLAKGR